MPYSTNKPGTSWPRGWMLWLVLLCALVLSVLNARAATLTVTNTADSGAGTLRDQVAAASPGDTINFSVTGAIMLTNSIIITQNLTIAGPGAGSLAVSGLGQDLQNTFSIFQISNGIVAISGLTLSDGNATHLGTNQFGGAVYMTGGAVTMTSNAFLNNFTPNGSGGAIYVSGGSLAIVSSSFSNNYAEGGSGGAIDMSSGSLTVTNSIFLINSAAVGQGGAICVSGGSVAVADSIISSNSAGNGGGICSAGTAMIASSVIFGNTAQSNSVALGIGGGIFNLGSMTIVNSTISSNAAMNTVDTTSTYGGGGVNDRGTMLTIANSTITLNSAYFGGGIDNGTGTLNLSNSIVASNTAVMGGSDIEGTVTSGGYNLTGQNPRLGPLANYGGPTPTHALLAGSPAIGAGDPNFDATSTPYDQRGPGFPRVSGGGLCIGAFQLEPNQTGSNFIVNDLTDHDYGSCGPTNGSLREAIKYSPAGTAITFGVTGTIPLTMDELLISNNLTITGPACAPGITVSGNNASRIFTLIQAAANVSPTVNFSTLTLSGGNGVSSTNSGYGGAVYIAPSVFANITNCTLSGNTATIYGGAIRNDGTLTIANSTFSGNSASNGGGVFLNKSTLTAASCTITGNSATSTGGGIFLSLVGNNSLSLSNTIVAGNSAATDPDLKGTVKTGDYDLVQNTAGATLSGSHNVTGQSALLGPLAWNGGPTQTCALLSGSPAIDAGSTTLTTDQRGVTRPQGPADDIGAFELGSIYPPTISIQALPPSQVQISWYTVTNAWYQLQYCSALTTNQWAPLGAWLEGGGQMISTNDSVLLGGPQRFYQVGVTNSP